MDCAIRPAVHFPGRVASLLPDASRQRRSSRCIRRHRPAHRRLPGIVRGHRLLRIGGHPEAVNAPPGAREQLFRLRVRRPPARSGDRRAGAALGGTRSECRLLPHSGPFVRGIHATLRASLHAPLADPVELYRQAYSGRPFIHVVDRPPELSAVVGTNFAHVHPTVRDDGRELIVAVVIDNLVKGAAGQAIQGMNLSLGFGETEGLEFCGLYPC